MSDVTRMGGVTPDFARLAYLGVDIGDVTALPRVEARVDGVSPVEVLANDFTNLFDHGGM